MIAQYMEDHGIEGLDLLHAFSGYPLSDLIVHRRDRHYNTKGNRLIALALGKYLKEKVVDIRRHG